MLQGYSIAIGNNGRWIEFDAIPFVMEPPPELSVLRQRLAYRQAFVAWLRARDRGAFARLLKEIETGKSFAKAFLTSYGADPQDQWQRFASALVWERAGSYRPDPNVLMPK